MYDCLLVATTFIVCHCVCLISITRLLEENVVRFQWNLGSFLVYYGLASSCAECKAVALIAIYQPCVAIYQPCVAGICKCILPLLVCVSWATGQPRNSVFIHRVCSRDKPPFSFVRGQDSTMGLATRTQISVCKSLFPSAGTAVSLVRAKTVQQRPVLPREVKTWLPDCEVTQ